MSPAIALAISLLLQSPPAEAEQQGGKWGSRIDDGVIYVFRSAEDAQSATLILRCGKRLDAYVYTGAEVNVGSDNETPAVTLTWDDEPEVQHEVAVSEQGKGLFFRSPHGVRHGLVSHKRLEVRFKTSRDSSTTARFDLRGLSDVIGPLQEACPVPLLAGVDEVSSPTLIPRSKVEPIYPMPARNEWAEGNVILQAIIDIGGNVTDVEILRCNNPGMGFEEAAVEAVRQWRYEPAMHKGQPVAVYFTLFVEFKLHGPPPTKLER